MPRHNIDYSKTIIYKIVCKDLNVTDLYVGSTSNFIKRKYTHKFSCTSENNKKYNFKVYQIIRENGGWDNWDMIEIEKFSCINKREAEAEEDKVMRELKATMNMIRAFLRPEDVIEDRLKYRATHIEEIKEKARIYRENLNKDENGNRTIDAYCEKLRKQKIYRDAYKERQKNKESTKSSQ